MLHNVQITLMLQYYSVRKTSAFLFWTHNTRHQHRTSVMVTTDGYKLKATVAVYATKDYSIFQCG